MQRPKDTAVVYSFSSYVSYFKIIHIPIFLCKVEESLTNGTFSTIVTGDLRCSYLETHQMPSGSRAIKALWIYCVLINTSTFRGDFTFLVLLTVSPGHAFTKENLWFAMSRGFYHSPFIIALRCHWFLRWEKIPHAIEGKSLWRI